MPLSFCLVREVIGNVSPGDKGPELLNHTETTIWATSHQRRGQGLTILKCALISEQWVWNHHHWTVIFSQPSVYALPSQASNVMIKSSLLKIRLRLLQWYDRELTALICHTKQLLSEFNRYSSTVNRVYPSARIAASNWSRIVLEPEPVSLKYDLSMCI